MGKDIMKGKRKVKFRRMNWDAEFYYDLLNGRGFVITEPAEMSLDGTKRKSLDGPQSPRYGTSYEDEQSFVERYRCECGGFVGRQFEGEICPICGKPVTYKDSDINVTGWISLGDNRVINPYYYNIFCKNLGQTIFPDMIYARYKVNTDGHQEIATEEDADYKPLSPFSGFGIDYFYEHYEEVLEYFKGVRKNKAKSIDLLLKQKRQAFTSHIPIASTLLRPQSITSDTFYFNSMDKEINTLFSLSENIKNCEEIERDYILHRIQTRINNIWDMYFDTLNLKEGFIRGEILGGSLNYTARNVIVPDPTLRDDQIDLSYHTFLAVFKYKIIYYLMKIDDINLSKAYNIWRGATIFDRKVYDIMQFIVENEDIRVLINRNPTLNFYSMLLMHIRKIKPDGDDYSLSVPLSIKNPNGKVESIINLFNCWNLLRA